MEGTLELSVKLLDTAPCQKELAVEVPPEAIEAEFDAVYQELKKIVQVPGFRVGYAPRDLLERYHGKRAREEVIHRLIGRSLEEALKSEGPLDLVGRPSVTNVDFDPTRSLHYRARVEVAPSVPLGSYKRLSLTRPKMEVTEGEVDKVLAQLNEAHAQLQPLMEPRASQEGDFLLVDLTEEQPGKPPLRRRDLVIHLDLTRDPEGILKPLLGMQPGEERKVSHPKGATLTVELKNLKVKVLSPLDDAFAKSVGPFQSLEALKEQIRKDLKARSGLSQRRALEQEAYRCLLEGWTFDVPPTLVASQARRLLKEKAVELMGQGVPASKVEEQAQALTDQAKLDALREVRLFFILRRIAQTEAIQSTDEELEAKLGKISQALNLPKEQVRNDLKERGLLEELAWGIVRGKVVDLMLREAEVREEN